MMFLKAMLSAARMAASLNKAHLEAALNGVQFTPIHWGDAEQPYAMAYIYNRWMEF